MYWINKALFFLRKGHERSVRAKKNIMASFVLKGINIASGLLIVPLALEYLDAESYGIWLTLSSIVMWFGFMDVGLGHGLRNRFATALAKNERLQAKRYVSTAYIVIAGIALVFFLLFALLNQFLDWSRILNTDKVSADELKALTYVVFGFFSMRLVLSLIGNILLADQKPALKDFIETSGKLLNLLGVYILIHTTSGSLLYLGFSYSCAPVIMLLFFTLYLFFSSYNEFIPRFRYFDITIIRDLLNLGGKFFLIQIASVVLFTTDNMIIANLFSPAEVTPYQIAHRYFGMALMVFLIVITPFWSAVSEAFACEDMGWIRRSYKKLVRIWAIMLIGLVGMLAISETVYSLWLGDRVTIPFMISLAWTMYVGLQMYGSLLTHFINGFGSLRISLYTASVNMLINIPLSIFLAKYLNMGVVGVLCATGISVFLSALLRIVQLRKLLNGNASGVWNA